MSSAWRTLVALVAGIVVGALLTTAIQGYGLPQAPVGSGDAAPGSQRLTRRPPHVFLAWVPGGLPAGFGRLVARTSGIVHATVVTEDVAWLRRSWAADGTVVDRPTRPFMIPLDVAAVRPRSFAPFLPASDRAILVELAGGEAVLGATSAALRGLGPGSTLSFAGGARLRVAGILPDELVGAAEVLVSRSTAAELGVTHDRYVLVHSEKGSRLRSEGLARRLRSAMGGDPDDLVQVRAPGETPYFRAGDAVLPPVLLKTLFGEFAGRPAPDRPGYLSLDPAWVRDHIVTVHVPLLGAVTCNAAIIPQLADAMRELQASGDAALVRSYHGCFAPRFVNRDPGAMLSHHAWGIALDLNLAGNAFGAPPHQDPRLVRVLRDGGFLWGGTFIIPDGNHFEYRRPAV
jgi:hypothetical protein